MLKVDRSGECWEWLACTDPNGYGRFRAGGRTVLAHRFAYEAFRDEIPLGLTIDHLCRNHGCVNPEHLEAVPNIVNVMRGDPGAYLRVKTHCKRGHELTAENVYVTPTGSRSCRACKRLRGQVVAA